MDTHPPKLGDHDATILLAAINWERSVVASAIAIIGTVGGGVLTWLMSHSGEMVGDWLNGENLDRATAAVILFFAFASFYLWYCHYLRKQGKDSLSILINNNIISKDTTKLLLDRDRRYFAVIAYTPPFILLGILVAILT